MAAIDESCSTVTLYTSKELDNTASDTDAAGISQNKRKADHNVPTTSRCTAPSAPAIIPKPKRAKFDPRRRQEVANVRKKGACMRCRIKKLTCSGSLPCESCQRNLSRVSFDRWEQCVSFSMKEVNIYIMDCPCNEDTYNTTLEGFPFTVVEKVCPSFDDMIKWDVGSISSEFVLWMSADDAQTGSTSLVGILSSSAFESMVSKFVDRSLSKHVRLLLELTSFLYSYGTKASYADCDWTSLWSLRSFSGTRVLQELEPALGPTSLAAASVEKLTALFLVLFATIIAVGYSKQRGPSRDLDASTSGLPVYQSPTSTDSYDSSPSAQVFSEAQEQLLRILALHMVYIAERIDLLGEEISRKRIIEGSASRWNRKATFQWKEMPAPKDADVGSHSASSCDVQDGSRRVDRNLTTGYPARCYHLSRSHPTGSSCRLAGGFGTCMHEDSRNIAPSPMDDILAGIQQMTLAPLDVQARTERTNHPRVDPESIRHAPHSTRRCSSDHLPSMSARDKNYAAFECLAENDGICAPFLCTDDDDNANGALSMDGSSAPTASPSTTQSTASDSPPSTRSQDSTSMYDSSCDQGSVCRSCKFDTLPYGTLDQDELCQFCSALPQHDGDISIPSCSALPQHEDDTSVPSTTDLPVQRVQLNWLKHEHGSVNLLV